MSHLESDENRYALWSNRTKIILNTLGLVIGMTSQQLSQIRFNISGSASPAIILPTGEVVPAAVQFTRSSSTLALTLTWPSGWFLQSATNVTGPYQDILEASSRYPVSMIKQQEFFRLRQQRPDERLPASTGAFKGPDIISSLSFGSHLLTPTL